MYKKLMSLQQASEAGNFLAWVGNIIGEIQPLFRNYQSNQDSTAPSQFSYLLSLKSDINWLKPVGTYQATLFAEEMNQIWTTKNILIQLPDVNFFPYKLQGTAQSFLSFHVTEFICIWLTRDLWIVTRANSDLRPNKP